MTPQQELSEGTSDRTEGSLVGSAGTHMNIQGWGPCPWHLPHNSFLSAAPYPPPLLCTHLLIQFLSNPPEYTRMSMDKSEERGAGSTDAALFARALEKVVLRTQQQQAEIGRWAWVSSVTSAS